MDKLRITRGHFPLFCITKFLNLNIKKWMGKLRFNWKYVVAIYISNSPKKHSSPRNTLWFFSLIKSTLLKTYLLGQNLFLIFNSLLLNKPPSHKHFGLEAWRICKPTQTGVSNSNLLCIPRQRLIPCQRPTLPKA